MVKRVRGKRTAADRQQLFEVTVSSLPQTEPCCGDMMSVMSVRVMGATDLGDINPDENFYFHEKRRLYYEDIEFRMWLQRDLNGQGSIEIRMNLILGAIKVAVEENRFKKDFRIQAEALVADMHRLLVDGGLHIVD